MQRPMVGQQHPAGADASRSVPSRLADQHLRRVAGDAADRMVFGDPEAVIAEPSRGRERERLADRLAGLTPARIGAWSRTEYAVTSLG